jgi:hypothetical protein
MSNSSLPYWQLCCYLDCLLIIALHVGILDGLHCGGLSWELSLSLVWVCASHDGGLTHPCRTSKAFAMASVVVMFCVVCK